MKPFRWIFLALVWLVIPAFIVGCVGQTMPTQSRGNDKKQTIAIGIEYAMPGMAETYSELGISAVKYYPDEFGWDRMQTSENATIDFSRMDKYVKEYQNAGFTNLVISLKTKNKWASKDIISNFTPKTEFLGLFENWIKAVVERYDDDGNNDMPGLRQPVNYLEVGVEFSSYEPEPVEEYISMLEFAYKAAHEASNNVLVLHAAFLVSMAFVSDPGPDQYTRAFGSVDKRIMAHSLSDIRELLNRPDIFDVVNFHALSYPAEIEQTVKWLKYEMGTRNYSKPIVISDTAVSPFLCYGSALVTRGDPAHLAITIPPAQEKDRERLKTYFLKLIDGDSTSLQWVHTWCATDMVKKVVIAAEQGISLIDIAFMEEFEPAKSKLFGASAGNNSWSGMALTAVKPFGNERTIKELRASFYAIKQLCSHLQGYERIVRLDVQDEELRVYKITNKGESFFIAWYEPLYLLLPGDEVPYKSTELDIGAEYALVEDMITMDGQTEAIYSKVKTLNGKLEINLTYIPQYIGATSSP